MQEVRQAAGLSREELAQRTGTTRGHIRNLEVGKHAPRPEMVAKLAAAVGMECDALLVILATPTPNHVPA